MTDKLLIDESELSTLLADLKKQAESLEGLFKIDAKGGQNLEFISQINEVNSVYKKLLTSYQGLLKQHANLTLGIMSSFITTDEEIANKMTNQAFDLLK